MLENENFIIRQAQTGNPDYFGLLYDHYLAALYRFVFLKVGHKQEAQDLVHDVFLSAWQHLESFDQRGFPFSSWLYQIARNRVTDHYRTKKKNLAIEAVSEENLPIADDAAAAVDTGFNLTLIRTALRHLGEEQQTVIILRFVEDLSYQEIATLLDKSEGAVRIIQHRALQNLRKIITDDSHGQFV